MIIAEIVLLGVLALKQSPVAVALLVPLVIITILFNCYLNKKHFYVTKYLSTKDCGDMDTKNEKEGMTLEFLEDAYLQPALKSAAPMIPENYKEIEGAKNPDEVVILEEDSNNGV